MYEKVYTRQNCIFDSNGCCGLLDACQWLVEELSTLSFYTYFGILMCYSHAQSLGQLIQNSDNQVTLNLA